MTPIDISKKVKWADVKRAHKYYYPADKNNYEDIFLGMQKLKNKKHKDPEEFIEVYCSDPYTDGIFTEENGWTVEEIMQENYYGVHTNKFSLSFRKWKEVFNIPIAKETLRHHKYCDILAHLLWEITFYGMEKDMEKKGKELKKMVDNCKKDMNKYTVR